MSDQLSDRLAAENQRLRQHVAELEQADAERQRAIRALEISEDLNRRIIESLPGGLVHVALDGSILQANQTAQQILGLSRDELNRRYIRDWAPDTLREDGTPCPPDEYPVARCLRLQTPQSPVTIGVRRPDGEISWAIFTAVPVHDPITGAMSSVMVTFLDITARKLAEESLRESEQRFKNLSEAAFEAIGVSDGNTLLQVNKRFLEMYGYEPEDVARLKVMDFIAPECWELVQSNRQRGIESPYEFMAVDSRGRTFPAEASGKAIPFQGRMVRVTAIRDISDRKRAEEAARQAHDELERRVELRTQELASANDQLRESEEKWRSLVTTAPDFILILDPKGVIQFINRVKYPATPAHIIGAHADDFVVPEYRALSQSCLDHVLTTGDYTACELVVQEVDGTRAWYHIRYGALRRDNQIVAVTAIGTDITLRKQAEEKLQAEEQLLRKLLELQEQERRLVAYELHDGLIQDLVGAQMLLEAARSNSDTAASGCQKLASVNSLLQKAIREGRRMIGDLRPLIIDELGIVAAIDYLIGEEKSPTGAPIAFEHDVHFTRLSPLLEGTIFRIVQESLTNIRRHSRARHGYVSLRQVTGDLHLVVRDDGIGFNPDSVSKDRFGLRGIHERARLFGGAAQIDSTPGKGTRVTVTVPLALPIESAASGGP